MKGYRKRDVVKKRRYAIEKDRRSVDPSFAISRRMGSLMWKLLKENKGGERWQELVGYPIDELMRHLEKNFLPGMSWDNRGEWHIDHKIPIVAFNYKTPNDIDFKKSWALSNLQPLWAKENILKGAKLDKPFQPSLAFGG